MDRPRLLHFLFLPLCLACGQNVDEPPVCGDQIVEAPEECDDGNTNNADGCEADCTLPRCQNGILDPGEVCFLEAQTLLSDGPSAIAIGDLNLDALPDLVVTNNITSDLGILLGQGNGLFTKAARFPTSNPPTSVALVDLNGDSLLDVVSSEDAADNNLEVFVNASAAGVLTLNPPQSFSSGGTNPLALATADINQDGLLDVAVINTDNNAGLFVNNGQVPPTLTPLALEEQPASLAFVDLNSDAFPELLVTQGLADQLAVFPNNAGTFGAPTNLSTGQGPKAITAGDFDADLDQDVAISLTQESAVQLFPNEAGALSTPTSVSVGFTPFAVQAIDLDNDLDLDLVTANATSNDASLLQNDATGSFIALPSIALGEQPVALQAADIDGDLRLDLFAVNEGSDEISLLRSGLGFNAAASIVLLGEPTVLAPVAANSLVVAHTASSDITLITNGSAQRIATPIAPSAVASADLNNDGQQDIILASNQQDSVVFFLQGGQSFSAPISVGVAPSSVVVGDFTGDGFVDIVTANAFSNDLTLLTSNADIANLSFTPSQLVVAGLLLPTAVAAGDLDEDGDLDLAVANGVNGDITSLLQNAGAFIPAGKIKAGTSISALSLGDLNDDGKPEVVAASLDNNDAQVFINVGFAAGIVQFKQPVEFLVGQAPVFVSFGDFDGDALEDIIVSNKDSEDLFLILNRGANGQGQEQFEGLPFALGDAPFGALIVDLNNDGLSDVLVGAQGARSLRVLVAAP